MPSRLPPGLRGRAKTVFAAALDSATQNTNGTQGTTHDCTWTPTTNDAAYIDGFTGGDSVITFLAPGFYVVDVSLVITDSAVNNRHTIRGDLIHEDDTPSALYTHALGSMYIRDDAGTYDSGSLGGQRIIVAAAGDRLILRTTVQDTQTTTGNAYLDQSLTAVRIQRLA